MNKERFHNALALNLGYDRILNDKSIDIKIEDATTEPVVTLASKMSQNSVRYVASENSDDVYAKAQKSLGALAMEQDLKEIIKAIHQAYIEANKHIY